jgi:spermidine synthase
VVLCSLFVTRPLRFGLGVAAILLASSFCDLLNSDLLARQRSFFGVLQVMDEGIYRRLYHGTTLHGQQRRLWHWTTVAPWAATSLAGTNPVTGAALVIAEGDILEHPGREPLTYFHPTGPVGQIFTAYQKQLAAKHVGLIGLGSGSLACYGQPGQTMTYFEIDPLVKRLAYDAHDLFSFVQDARDRGVQMDLVLGDARLKLEERAQQGPPDKFALLVVDAFSSDAIPVHLLTREALQIYLANLADDGILAIHISNRYLELEPVLSNLAKDLELAAFAQGDTEGSVPGKAASNWVVLARHASDLDRLLHAGRWEQWQEEHGWDASADAMLMLSSFPDVAGMLRTQGSICLVLHKYLRAPWRKLKVRPEVGVWTDDYSNLLRVFDWKH